MDNASNCDAMARFLPTLIPTFQGMASCGRCFPHIINLLAKVSLFSILHQCKLTESQIFISFFFKKTQEKACHLHR
jgi:hypothetical protein